MQRWGLAMREALYGSEGFYVRRQPSDHFRTSVTASPQYASAVARLVRHVDAALGHPPTLDVVDIGAGDGGLLVQLLGALPAELAARVRAVAVDVGGRPGGLPRQVQWATSAPPRIAGVVMAHELLDNVPCDVVIRHGGEVHEVLVDASGRESIGPPVSGAAAQWLERWWPLNDDGDRAECGAERDRVWRDLVGSLVRGIALAVDYGHLRDERAAGGYAAGTMTAYRAGHQVAPVPDGSCDITAHVAMDACQAAGTEAGAEQSKLVRQRDALHSLGLRATLPSHAQATTQPLDYVRQLSEASAAGELLDPGSLGSFWWLLQGKGVAVPLTGTGALSG